MPKQDFKATALLTEEQEAGTLLRCEALGRQWWLAIFRNFRL